MTKYVVFYVLVFLCKNMVLQNICNFFITTKKKILESIINGISFTF